MTTPGFVAHLRKLRHERRDGPRRVTARSRPTRGDREAIAAKTGGRCHICGGLLDPTWEADHVLAVSSGGASRVDNFLAAHSLCNNYRWNYGAEEFQWVLKIGVWARLVIEGDTPLGRTMAAQFSAYEHRRTLRRRPPVKER